MLQDQQQWFLYLVTLKGVKFDGEHVLTTLISSCSVLEELVMVTHRDDLVEVICVRFRSLKSFKLKLKRGEDLDEDEHPGDPLLEIDVPGLEYMSICDYQTNSFIIHNIGPLAKVNIDFVVAVEYDDPSERIMMSNILTALSTVGEMIISARTLEMIDDYCELEEPVPQFQTCLGYMLISLTIRGKGCKPFLVTAQIYTHSTCILRGF